jgi:hypothetical protein
MRFAHLLAILIASTLAGCSRPPTSLSPRTPHGGMIFALTDAPGSVEVVRQTAADKPGVTRLYLYWLDAEMKPMTPAPTLATLKTRGRGTRSFDFKPSSESDPSKAGALVSPDLPDQGDIDGELSVTMNGKSVALSISIR